MSDPQHRVVGGGPRGRRWSVLVVAPSDVVGRSVSRILARMPFDVSATGSPADGLARAKADPPDLVVVECGAVTAMSHYLHDLRSVGSRAVILVGEDAAEGILCLEAGAADDFVRSPIFARELQARAGLHAGVWPASGILEFEDLVIDLRARSVRSAGCAVDLTPREFDLLAFLAARVDATFTRAELLQRVWQSSPDWQQVETVSEHVYRLRRKLEADPSHPAWIVTVPQSGYSFRSAPASSDRRHRAVS